MSASYETNPTFRFTGVVDTLFAAVMYSRGRLFDVSPDDQRFLVLQYPGAASATEHEGDVIQIQNFFSELRARVPAG